jgi:hypothetical protein
MKIQGIGHQLRRLPRQAWLHRLGGVPLVQICIGIGLAVGCHSNSATTGTNADGSVDNTIVFLDAGSSTPISPDGGPLCPSPGCNYQTQQGCGTGQMCHPELNGSNVEPQCVTAGTKAAGESCSWQECQSGLFCAADGHCRHLCCAGDWSVCASNETCASFQLQFVDAGSPRSANVSVCELADHCDVLDPNSCSIGESCYIVDSRGGVRCLPTGNVALNGGCTATSLCKAGFTCVESATGTGAGTCRRLCRAVPGGADPYCPASEGYCSHFVQDPPEVGECTPTH